MVGSYVIGMCPGAAVVVKHTILFLCKACFSKLRGVSCAGVRVLFQVAVVLVRRVLGRAEQRQECSGQMETLERLRAVREILGQEDDTSFMAEVSSQN